ncbi:unnamed protein product [Meloidogyne enterolobii]|uniref:Uncharacterized protein n=1 Tax=Meloidogyne enterolobii TaxID=390850 RepID=A0ACB0Y4R9_MELEN
MLFCLLHPMDHNTGPLARKSTTLCALLPISIAALLVLAIPGQANVEEVGVADHIKNGSDVTLKAVSKQASDDLTYAEYVKTFPTVCNFSITKEHIELLYKGKECTVELITTEINIVKFTTGYVKAGCTLDTCDDGKVGFKHGFSNLLPFAYSRNNTDIENFNKGPSYGGNLCDEEGVCGGRCMNQTFLEVSWSKCKDNVVFAHTHLSKMLIIFTLKYINLVGESKESLDQFQNQKGDRMEFNLEIYANNSLKMISSIGAEKDFDNGTVYCIQRQNAIVNPETWNIKNGDGNLKDKHLLVFHLLPPKATVRYDEKYKFNTEKLQPQPKCQLFIHFKRPAYEFLEVDPRTTTTSTTTTTPKPTSGPKPQPTVKATSTPPEQKTTQKVQEATATEGGSKAWIWIFVIFVVIAVIGGAVGFYFYRKNQKIKEEDEKERAFWAHFADKKWIAEENKSRSEAKLPSLEDVFVKDIFDRMKKEDEDNAAKNVRILFKGYLPDLKKDGFKIVGTYREWKKKSDWVALKVEYVEGDDVEEDEVEKDESAEGKKKKGGKGKKDKTPKDSASKMESTPKDPAQKEETTSKDSTLKKDPAPEKADATKSKQAGTTSDVPTDMVSEAKETDQ